ncbi:MAG TPA: N-acetyl-alpha-D-glucosaminyl L-malate synthase BshA, partial [Gemmatimonadaceae bacterium]|nr:N-acetyl-alpha-D-glucosaminyl L-malate synthase BshA [Gemmatimonadaceae bacterium]
VGQDPSFYPITKFSIEKSDRITAVSQYLREETCRAFGCDGPDVEVIHNFIEPDIYDRAKYPPLLKNEVGRSKPILMHVSNFRTVKRVRDVVRIYAEVNRELPSVLVMIGDGPDRPAAEEEARLLGVEHSVSFLGKLDQIAPLLAAADLFLLPSQNESFGLSALEALASGVPVVGSNAGGLPEVVRDGETGILCAVGDVAGMAAASLEILQDRKRWAEMSKLAAADARQRFSRDAIVTKYESLYRDSLTPINS